MNNANIEDFSKEELIRILQRDRFVKEQLSARVAGLIHENLELTGIIQELQGDLGELRQGQATLLADSLIGNGQAHHAASAEPAQAES